MLKIAEFKSVLNKGLPVELDEAFPEGLTPVQRPTVLLAKNINIDWFVGFIDAEGCFTVNISKDTTKIGFKVQLNFNITQHIRDANLFNLLNMWLDCGHVYEIPKDVRVNLVITSFKDIVNILIPMFNKHILHGIKKSNYDDFLLIVKLMEKKKNIGR